MVLGGRIECEPRLLYTDTPHLRKVFSSGVRMTIRREKRLPGEHLILRQWPRRDPRLQNSRLTQTRVENFQIEDLDGPMVGVPIL